MVYPLLTEYIEAIKSSQDNMDALKYLSPVLDNDGNPVMSSGNFAVVFKMKDEETGRHYALKCFLRDQERRSESYRLISDELSKVDSPYLTTIKYLDKELFVDSRSTTDTEFPVLLMDWVDGVNLDKYVRDHIDDQYELSMLAYRFSQLAMWLLPQPFAHGDLKQDNILVKEDGSLVLVDYDGMYVPAMKGQLARELGSPDFRHPLRTESTFNEHIDDFSVVSILLSLKAIAVKPSLSQQYGAADRLLFCERDYQDPDNSDVLKELNTIDDSELKILSSVFTIALQMHDISLMSPQLLNIKEPIKHHVTILSTNVTEEELANAWIDEFGVKYSADKLKLLKAPQSLHHYSIKLDTEIICDSAFRGCVNMTSIVIPNNVTSIGKKAFQECHGLKSIVIPDGVSSIGEYAFRGCYSLTSIIIPNGVKRIEKYTFFVCGDLTSVVIPDSVTSIGESAFGGCEDLTSIIIPDSVTHIEDYAFSQCKGLTSIVIPESVISIGQGAFMECVVLKTISISDSVESIGDYAFSDCKVLTSIEVSEDNPIYDSRFNSNAIIETKSNTLIRGCHCTVIPNNVTSIGKDAFSGCLEMMSKDIPDSVKDIGEGAFRECKDLTSIFVPDSVKRIGMYAFSGCNGLSSIVIPYGVTSIGQGAFEGCEVLSSIVIPESVTFIGPNAFSGCSVLKYIIIPINTKDHFEKIIPELKHLLKETNLEVDLSDVQEFIPSFDITYEYKSSSKQIGEKRKIGKYFQWFDSKYSDLLKYGPRLAPNLKKGVKFWLLYEMPSICSKTKGEGIEAKTISWVNIHTSIGNLTFNVFSSLGVLNVEDLYLQYGGQEIIVLEEKKEIRITTNGLPIMVSYYSMDKAQLHITDEEYKEDTQLFDKLNKTNGFLHYGREYVDLGLSVKWASCNVGASKPEEYGYHYAWGERFIKSQYSYSSYRYRNNEKGRLTKYCNNSKYGYNNYVDNKVVLDKEDDVAQKDWGYGWRMPTKEEIEELLEKCSWEWTTVNKVCGYKVTSKIPGYTDRYIFLPAAGFYDDDKKSLERTGDALIAGVLHDNKYIKKDYTNYYESGQSGLYWSSSLHTSTDHPPMGSYNLHFCEKFCRKDVASRKIGMSVRPVFSHQE